MQIQGDESVEVISGDTSIRSRSACFACTKHLLSGKVTGTTGRRRLPNKIFASLKIPQVSLNLQQSIADEATKRRDEAKKLRTEAEAVVAAAKARVERMILGEEIVD